MTRAQVKRKIPRKAALFVAIVATALAVGSTLAVHDSTAPGTGPMELEGNVVDGAAAGTDWQAIFNASGDEIAAALPAGTLDTTGVIDDFVPGASGPDISYHEPSNKDDQAISATGGGEVWGCVSVPNPTDKTDIVNAYGMAVQGDAEAGDGDTADDQLFYFGVERYDNSGDAFIGVWLFQDDVSCNLATGKFEGSKRTGDILILSNFTGGGSNASVQLFRYTAGVGTAAGTFGEVAATATKCENANEGDGAFPINDLCATINDTNKFTTPWAMEDKTKPGPPTPDPINEVDPDQFVEGGVNLTDVFASAAGGGAPPPCFGSFMAETRSSASIDATLKDFALGNLDFCDADIEITPTETNRVGEQHTFTVDVDQKVGSGEQPATVGDVEYTLTGSNGIEQSDIIIDGGTCVNGAGVENDLNAAGQCTIIFHSDAGGIITGHATVDVNVGGTLLTRSTNGLDGSSGDAVKTYVDALITVAADETNQINDSHTFTVHVEGDNGGVSGMADLAGVFPVITFPGGAPGTVNATDCTTNGTDANGDCDVIVNSSVTGAFDIHASVSVTLAGLTFSVETDGLGNNSGDATKTYVDVALDIAGDGTNQVGTPHDFTVTAWADDGGGAGLVLEGGVLVTVDFTEALGTDAIADDTCTTEADDQDPDFGTCSVTFNSSKTGTHTGTASATINAGPVGEQIGILATTSADSTTDAAANAVKTWVNAQIGITGNDTNSIEEDHTFTVLLEKDLGDGAGFVPAGSEDVDVTLTDTLGAVHVLDTALTSCDVDSHDGAGTDATAGTCDVVFTSSSAGTVTGEATSTLTVGGVSITVSTDDVGSTGDAVKVFVDGSIRWFKHDGDGVELGGATFLVCRTARLDSDTGLYVAEDPEPFCFTVRDNDGVFTTDPYDADEDPGQLQVNDLILGQYNVTETIPPAGYHIGSDPGAGPFNFPDMTIEPLNVDVTLDTIFVNIKAFRIIVITCDDIDHTLVVSAVTLADGTPVDSMSAADLASWNLAHGQDVTEAQICGGDVQLTVPSIGGAASFGDLPDGTYGLSVIVPKAS